MIRMAKPSAYAMKLKAQKQFELEQMRLFTMQWCADAAALAANDVFKRKGKKIVEFLKAMEKYSQEIASTTLEDAKTDKDIEYTKAKVDERLKEILGDDFQPWDERYIP